MTTIESLTTHRADPAHSQLLVTVLHLGLVPVSCRVTEWSCDLSVDGTELLGTCVFDLTSLDSGNAMRDEHVAALLAGDGEPARLAFALDLERFNDREMVGVGGQLLMNRHSQTIEMEVELVGEVVLDGDSPLGARHIFGVRVFADVPFTVAYPELEQYSAMIGDEVRVAAALEIVPAHQLPPAHDED